MLTIDRSYSGSVVPAAQERFPSEVDSNTGLLAGLLARVIELRHTLYQKVYQMQGAFPIGEPARESIKGQNVETVNILSRQRSVIGELQDELERLAQVIQTATNL